MSERRTGASTEQALSEKPAFNGGAFTISAFSPSREGFQIGTRNVLGRTEGIATNKALNADARSGLKAAMQGEMKFNKVQDLRDARTAWRAAIDQGAPKEERDRLKHAFYEERARYQEKGKKVGIRNITLDGNQIGVDTKMVSFPVYNRFNQPEDSAEILDWSKNAAAMIVRSADGRIVVQHRAVAKQRLTEEKLSSGNSQYADIPGASVAGLMDASLKGKDRKPGTTDPIDTNSVKGHIKKEAAEELGLEDKDLKGVTIVGLAHDKIKVHDEFLLLATSNLTAEQIREKSRATNKNKNLGPADFEEKFIDIDGSAESIATLLTQVKCPLPPTHAAALVASGYSLVLQEKGKPAADKWKDEVEKGVQANYADIDKRVKDFYDAHPEVLMQVPERFWGKTIPARKLHGYDPAYAPDEQGLPAFEDAMVDAGLMKETRRVVLEADLFDVDGVITDPTTKEVIHPEILDQIANRLKSGIPIALNTGRSIEWLKEPVLKPLLERFKDDKNGLENLALIGEFGGTWATFNEAGQLHEGQVGSLTIPQELHQVVNALVEQNYKGSMADDPTKRTMLSIEMHTGHDLAAFHADQNLLVEQLNKLLTDNKLDNTYIVHQDTIATNIMSPRVGKDLGAARFLQFLRDKGIKPARYRTFGDSMSDVQMAHELLRRGLANEFVFVGKDEDLAKAKTDRKIKDGLNVVTPGRYSEGIKDFLTQN